MKTTYINSIQGNLIRKYQKWVIKEKGIWFIDIPKTSSTSIRTELGRKYGLVYAKSHRKLSFQPHKSGSYMINYLGHQTWDRLFTFTIVRNPWDKSLSYFLWAKSKGYLKEFNFRAFVYEIKRQVEAGNSFFSWYGPYASCSDYIYSEDGELLVDFVGKYENRTNDMEVIREKINRTKQYSSVTFSKNTLGKLKLNSNDERNRHLYYDLELARIIENIYRTDIENFDYSLSTFF